jgi:GTP 3',8-cyclase
MNHDKYRIDSHKLSLHPERVAQWFAAGDDWEKQKKVYPLYVEISPSGSCNHRCSFCAVDYIGYKNVFLAPEVLQKCLDVFAAKGVKSIMFAGEGEPLLMKGLGASIVYAKRLGLDIGITTNASPLTEKFVTEALASISWIKASINAGTAAAYSQIHNTKAADFDRVFANLAFAVRFRNQEKLQTTLGAQAVLIPENLSSIDQLCQRAKDIGLDYLVIKPYSQHNLSQSTRERGYETFDYQAQMQMSESLAKYNDSSFQVIFRANTMKFLTEPARYYQKCEATPNFWAYVMASGDVYGCSAYLLDKKFCYGNINQTSFEQIWEGEARRQSAHYVRTELKIEECRKNCRMEHVNRYLWDLKNPGPHDNFI